MSESIIESSNEARSPRSVGAENAPIKPSDAAFDLLAAGVRRTNNRETQVRRAFVNADRGGSPTPLSRIVRGGRAAAVRLRLFLALLWMAGGGDERHQVTFPARAWAELLSLEDPGHSGQRRIRAAFAWLESAGLLETTRAPGRPPTLTLLREDGTGAKYVTPTRAPKDPKTNKLRPHDWSVALPPTFWANGWVLALSTPGLALLLVMLDLKRPNQQAVWVSPDQAQRRYGLSEDTWARGIAELRQQRLVDVSKQPVSQAFGWSRVRNTYSLNMARLRGHPDWR